jgi:predicted RND superfamily exporter protein
MRDKMLKNLAAWHANHPWRMLTLTLILTIIMWGFASQLTMTMRTSDLLPEGDPHVVQFNKIVDEFKTSTNLVVVVQGEEKRIKEFADELAPQIESLYDNSQDEYFRNKVSELKGVVEKMKVSGADQENIKEVLSEIAHTETRINFKIFQRVDYKAEIDFLKDHALMLVKAEDLQNTKDIFTDPNLTALITNLNNSMEKEYVGQEESISTREKEDGAVMFLDGIEGLVDGLTQTIEGERLSDDEIGLISDKILFGDPYMLSYDKQALVMIAVPNFTLLDRDLIQSRHWVIQP